MLLASGGAGLELLQLWGKDAPLYASSHEHKPSWVFWPALRITLAVNKHVLCRSLGKRESGAGLHSPPAALQAFVKLTVTTAGCT